MPDNSDPYSQQIEQIRPKLVAFAQLQLRDENLAEDVVQDTLVAAFVKEQQFRSDAQWQTWVFAILKNKIIDALRSKQRHQWQHIDEQENQLDAQQHQQFHHGNWIDGKQPQDWGDPQFYVHQQDFMTILQLCLDNLPENTARIFLMKEIMELSISEIAQCTELSTDNCHTIMYRARNGLRGCLQKHWFNDHA